MVGEILTIIVAALKLVMLGLDEYFAAKRRERLAVEEYEKRMNEQLKIMKEAIMRIRIRAKRESEEAKTLEEQREADRKKTLEGNKS
jgi:hypothetical protein